MSAEQFVICNGQSEAFKAAENMDITKYQTLKSFKTQQTHAEKINIVTRKPMTNENNVF